MPATRPPVQDSAVATVRFFALAEVEQRACAASTHIVIQHRADHLHGRRTVAVAIGHHAFAAADEAHALRWWSPSRRRGPASMPAISAMRARIASRCGPIRGASQTIGDVEMRDHAAALGHALDREFEEAVRRRALPLRIARRKVLADVAVGERAEDGVDDGVQHHVGVGMSGQAAVMRDPHAAERDVIAGAEGVHVEADAGADVGQAVAMHASRPA